MVIVLVGGRFFSLKTLQGKKGKPVLGSRKLPKTTLLDLSMDQTGQYITLCGLSFCKA